MTKMITKLPVVSVVMAAYNSERFIGEAIQSILDQSFKNFELIIVNDCSHDTTWKIIKKYSLVDKRIGIYQNIKNMGGCQTLNIGMSLAKGKYIAVMDNDDWSYPERLEKQVNFLEKNPKVGIVGGTMEIIDENGVVSSKRKYNLDDADIRKNLFRYSPFAHPLIMMRRSVLEIVGYGDCEYAPADDYELYFRIGTVAKFANLKDTIFKYRVVANSMTQRMTKKMILTTVKTRNTYRKIADYRMGFADGIFNLVLWISAYILPSKIILGIFNLVRNNKES
jgi:glycosyltransferase involved in cell wall biosynthesis